MNIRASCFCAALALSFASAGTTREFQTADGLVRLALIPDAPISKTASAIDEASESAADGGADSSRELPALFPGRPEADALLQVYLLEKSTGKELRFPIRYPQLRTWWRRHPAPRASVDARMVDMIRDLSLSLKVHMKAPSQGGGK